MTVTLPAEGAYKVVYVVLYTHNDKICHFVRSTPEGADGLREHLKRDHDIDAVVKPTILGR
jgi:hypothetical protein